MPTTNRPPPPTSPAPNGASWESRERLLDAAIRLFLKNGYSGVSTADIASAADAGAGTFYLHFEDKLAILRALGKRGSPRSSATGAIA